MKAPRTAYTTGEVARLLGLSIQTVIRCCDSGVLKNYEALMAKYPDVRK